MFRLLVVDDDDSQLALKRIILEAAGYEVQASSSLIEAQRRLEEERFEAVLADWWFRKEDAMQLVRNAKVRANTPVLIVSGFIQDALVTLGPAADFYLQKPVDAADLLTALESLAFQRRSKLAA